MDVLYYLLKNGKVVCRVKYDKIPSMPDIERVWLCKSEDRVTLMRMLIGLKSCKKIVSGKKTLAKRIKEIEVKNKVTRKDYRFARLVLAGINWDEAHALVFRKAAAKNIGKIVGDIEKGEA